MNIIPCLLIRNEEIWIKRILTALSNVFPHIIVTDTGSTDDTLGEIIQVPNVILIEKGLQEPRGLTALRQFMQDEARRRWGATHIFLIDGDELYPTKYLRYIAENPMPETALSGFTSGIECGELPNGEIWFYNAGLNRQAIIPVDSIWKGVYPFESPSCYIPGHPTNHYFPAPEGTHGFYHLHHTRRSRMDADVYLREEKRDQFSLRNAPEIYPEIFWLKRQEEYIDE